MKKSPWILMAALDVQRLMSVTMNFHEFAQSASPQAANFLMSVTMNFPRVPLWICFRRRGSRD
jgi:hypothetical protein